MRVHTELPVDVVILHKVHATCSKVTLTHIFGTTAAPLSVYLERADGNPNATLASDPALFYDHYLYVPLSPHVMLATDAGREQVLSGLEHTAQNAVRILFFSFFLFFFCSILFL